MKKVIAFTLSELLVVLVISSIAVTLSFLALNNVQKQIRNINTIFEKQQAMTSLERIMNRDLNQYQGTYNQKNQKLLFVRFQDTVQYHFKEHSIIRNTDSIALKAKNITFYLEGEKVRNGIIDAIEFSFENTYTQNGLFVYKRKDASYYIN
jgi:prepilin-type N-terminal cleavage/methylation domain-containing protein